MPGRDGQRKATAAVRALERADANGELTDLGTHLRTDVADEQRSLALLLGNEISGRSWANLAHAVRTGEIPFEPNISETRGPSRDLTISERRG